MAKIVARHHKFIKKGTSVCIKGICIIHIESLQKVASLKSRIDGAAIPAATKADLRGKISKLEVSSMLL